MESKLTKKVQLTGNNTNCLAYNKIPLQGRFPGGVLYLKISLREGFFNLAAFPS